ncbi:MULTISPECIES: hypothetical protein [Thermoanaerobacter]|jgi:uncharacterized protein YceK|uniref:Lipoprotein n=2 Tax=Thermoanaerobacter TaxID=1754 RepID=B0KCN7_THEP3|nr:MULTISPECIES: hypothetical protein [Thermoanaerobacter]ABY95494.1 hypothetical protein Teth39_1860 [Thermoanaerobacter pseudethanolicus ATCC 33223]ADV80436.1 hypothetical protein Thebr_1909 [Thermoanaerobacter brockii subsp. finnii Ako-1]MBZ4656380.1 hypothetical protein [Thermoanaerobacter sp.]HBW60731.1 hypothetical protein [Thermoanaerobacter sp.]
MRKLLIILMVILFLSGCYINITKTDKDSSESIIPPVSKTKENFSEKKTNKINISELPKSKEETATIEGVDYKVSYTLFDCSKLSPGFITYIPENMETSINNFGDGSTTVRIETSKIINGQFLHDYDYIEITFLPRNVDKSYAIEKVKGLANKYKLKEEQKIFNWAIFQRNGVYGVIVLGEHEGRYFYIIIHPTLEASDMFNPIAKNVIKEFIWVDTGTRL